MFAKALELIVENIGMQFENVVLLIITLGSIIFAAKDFKLALVILMATTGGLFIWFYESGYTYVYAEIVFLMSIVLLTLTLFTVSRTSNTQGGFI